MQHKRATKHNFFRLKQIWTVIQNRITVHICLNARKLTMFCCTLFFTMLCQLLSGCFDKENVIQQFQMVDHHQDSSTG